MQRFSTHVLFTVAIIAGVIWGLLALGNQARSATLSAEEDSDAYLPAVLAGDAMATPESTATPSPTATSILTPTASPSPSPTATPDPLQSPLENGSFEDSGWLDIPGQDIQQPAHWALSWVEPGEPLFDSTDLASGVCECVHKLSGQLPPHERPGGSNPLILEGDVTYKIFKSSHAFGTELSQSFSNMPPGSEWRLTVPVRVHIYGDPDPFGAESSIWVNNVGAWANALDMGDRKWCKHEQVFTVPANGQVDIDIRLKNKWQKTKDFFVDDVTLAPASEPAAHPELDLCLNNTRLQRYRPVSLAPTVKLP